MITLEELKNLAEAAARTPIQDWVYDDPDSRSQELDRIAVVAGATAARFIAEITPATLLKLREMIRVLREGVEFCVECRGVEYDFRDAELALQRADAIERSL